MDSFLWRVPCSISQKKGIMAGSTSVLCFCEESTNNVLLELPLLDISEDLKVSKDSSPRIRMKIECSRGVYMFDFTHLGMKEGRKMRSKAKAFLADSIHSTKEEVKKEDIERVNVIKEERIRILQQSELRDVFDDLVVKGKVLTVEEFWKSRESELVLEAGKHQTPGLSNRVPSDSAASLTMHTETITARRKHAIFSQYPSVWRAYCQLVPTKIPEREFWKQYFASAQFHGADIPNVGKTNVVETELLRPMDPSERNLLDNCGWELYRNESSGYGYGTMFPELNEGKSTKEREQIMKHFHTHADLLFREGDLRRPHVSSDHRRRMNEETDRGAIQKGKDNLLSIRVGVEGYAEVDNDTDRNDEDKEENSVLEDDASLIVLSSLCSSTGGTTSYGSFVDMNLVDNTTLIQLKSFHYRLKELLHHLWMMFPHLDHLSKDMDDKKQRILKSLQEQSKELENWKTMQREKWRTIHNERISATITAIEAAVNVMLTESIHHTLDVFEDTPRHAKRQREELNDDTHRLSKRIKRK